ncbi:hypothetical protein SPRG_06076 [Saprolegnia parasitica CBS 223.65]|uniref:B30.2/SPRY domain-containing protein n=1 Tax=Saprolegnia parasitica (strain CBS 223.65) TaxID=695850 RepID=A0A067CR53_SAPPC|nr:hypothetical protein SPRG_06076 [Saprolegnia parasitica CBS 223.65]KDO29021.1 hypothetical protein SPRG_06076 [Saprolegnia parasitica CBS 223.65]|eukprot:XP_012200191.1 hypothetical protein SPRG_06076 [Saprolegnia parasitica CBS 223.65]
MKRAEEYAAVPTKRPRAEDKPDAPPAEERRTVRFVEKGTLLSLADDGLTVTGSKGYCMARANCGVRHGRCYYEITLQPADVPYHVRFGVGTKKADINAPVGFDEFSYAYRDLEGAVVHKSTRRDGYGAVFGPGDVVGALLVLPDRAESGPDPTLAPANPASPSIGSESPRVTPAPDLKKTSGTLRFFVNGVDQGVAFDDLPCGDVYYPCVSIYHAGSVVANFGPAFKTHDMEDSAIPYASPSP